MANNTTDISSLMREFKDFKSSFENFSKFIDELNQEGNEINTYQRKIENDNKELQSQIQSLKKKNNKLEDEATHYQSRLGIARNFKMSDDDKNHNTQLNKDIISLQYKIGEYVTDLVKVDVNVNIDEINKLLPNYKCQTKIDPKQPNRQFLKAILQRHVLVKIFEFAKKYFSRDKKDYYLESDIVKKTDELEELMKTLACTRGGTDEITNYTHIRLRQLIYAALGMRGLGDIIESDNLRNTHKSIKNFSENLNSSMNQYRAIIDPKEEKNVNESAESIIREVFRIFYFRLKTQEPTAKYKWLECNDKFDEKSMTSMLNWDVDEIDDLVVDLCIFPLIYQDNDNDSKPKKILTHAKVFTRQRN